MGSMSVVDTRLIDGWWRDCTPAALIAFPLNDVPLVACLLGGIVNVGKDFWRMSLLGEIYERWDSDLN